MRQNADDSPCRRPNPARPTVSAPGWSPSMPRWNSRCVSERVIGCSPFRRRPGRASGRDTRRRPARAASAASPRARGRPVRGWRRRRGRRWPGRRTARAAARPARRVEPWSRKPQIVNAMVRSWTTGARLNIDARRSPMPRQPRTASSTVSPARTWIRRTERVGDLDREALIGPLEPEPAALGLEPVDLRRAVGHPAAGHVIGRLVAPRVVGRRDGANFGAAIAPFLPRQARARAAGRRRGPPRAPATTPR